MAPASSDSPLRDPVFRRFYAGIAATSFGYAMLATSGAWLMATLSPSPLMVALVQSASTFPSLLLGLLAGAMADMIDRRHLLVISHLLLSLAAMALALATYHSVITPIGLLAGILIAGVGFTFSLPVQQAMVGDLVPHKALTRAVSLAAVAMNVSRAAAPALAGGMVSLWGTGSVFLASAIFLSIMIVSVRTIGPIPGRDARLHEQLFQGIRSGLRFMRHSPPTLACISRNFMFCLFGSSILALLPLVARDQLTLGAWGYGLLLGCFGSGAILGSLLLNRTAANGPSNRKINLGMSLFGIAIALIGNVSSVALAALCTALSGTAWVMVLGYLFSGALSWSPAWVRARIISANMLAIQAGLALGSALWGWLALETTAGMALTVSALCLFASLALSRKIQITYGTEDDVTMIVSTPEMSIALEPHISDGPVLIQYEYKIDPERYDQFCASMRTLENVRRRNGADEWGIYRNLEEGDCYYERFIVASWGDYNRLHRRSTVFDKNIEVTVRALQKPGVPIRISRLIAL